MRSSSWHAFLWSRGLKKFFFGEQCTNKQTLLPSYPPPPPPLRCKIDGDVTHKAWLNRSNILFTGRDKWSLDPRVLLVNSNDSDFSIQIERVAVSDEGPYTCSFQARNQPRTSHVYLIVQGEGAGLLGSKVKDDSRAPQLGASRPKKKFNLFFCFFKGEGGGRGGVGENS